MIAKTFVRKIFLQRFHLRQRLQATKILRRLEIAKGKTDPKLIKLSDEYAREVLGWRGYAPWLYVYCAVAQNFKEGWIPGNYYRKVVLPTISGDYGNVSRLRSLSNKLFQSNVFPDIAYYVNGLFFSKNYEILREDDMKDYLFKNSEVVVFKVDGSLRGKGVFLFERASFDAKKVQVFGNGVFQDYIDQHQSFEELMPASVATLRITTILDDRGKASLRACYLRIGRSADTHVKSASHIRIPVNQKSGELGAHGYLSSWLTIKKHPDTQTTFAKRKIPSFNKCVSTGLELHELIPYQRCVGWDMTIDKNHNVRVMEWNGSLIGTNFSEATQGPCYSDLGWEKLWRLAKTGVN